MSTLIHRTDWSFLPNLAAVAAGTSPGDGWLSLGAGAFGVASGRLTLTWPGGADAWTSLLLRPGSEAALNVVIEQDFIGQDTAERGVILYDPATGNFYAASYSVTYTSFAIVKQVAGAFSYLDSGGNSTPSAPAADHHYRLRLERNGTTLKFTQIDLTTGSVWQTVTGTDSSAALQIPLIPGIFIRPGGSGSQGLISSSAYSDTGALSYVAATPQSITLAMTPAPGSIGHTYLHRSETSAYLPHGVTAGAGTCIAVDPVFTYTDSTPVPGVEYHYRVVSTNTAGQTLISNQISAATQLPALKFLGIGDSIMAGSGTDPLTQMANALAVSHGGTRAVAICNQAVSGMTSADFATGSGLLMAARAAAVSQFGTPNPATNPVWALYFLGTNDAKAIVNRSLSLYQSNVAGTVNDLLAAGYSGVILLETPYAVPGSGNGFWDETSLALIEQYNAWKQSYANGNTIRYAGQGTYAAMANNPSFTVDGIHPSVASNVILGGAIWASTIDRALSTAPMPATGYYANQSDIEDLFGRTNVARWSQLDIAQTGPDSARIARALAYGDAEIDGEFRGGPYPTPLDSLGSPVVRNWAATFAGLWLYRNASSLTATTAPVLPDKLLAEVRMEIALYKSGIRQFPGTPSLAPAISV